MAMIDFAVMKISPGGMVDINLQPATESVSCIWILCISGSGWNPVPGGGLVPGRCPELFPDSSPTPARLRP